MEPLNKYRRAVREQIEDPVTSPMLWLYRNMGDGRLEPYQFRTTEFTERYILAPRFADVNGDRLTDLTVVADFENSQLYLNVGDGMFENVTATNGTGSDEQGMGSAIGDYDNDGDLDWFVTSIFDGSGTPERDWGVTGNASIETAAMVRSRTPPTQRGFATETGAGARASATWTTTATWTYITFSGGPPSRSLPCRENSTTSPRACSRIVATVPLSMWPHRAGRTIGGRGEA